MVLKLLTVLEGRAGVVGSRGRTNTLQAETLGELGLGGGERASGQSGSTEQELTFFSLRLVKARTLLEEHVWCWKKLNHLYNGEKNHQEGNEMITNTR